MFKTWISISTILINLRPTLLEKEERNKTGQEIVPLKKEKLKEFLIPVIDPCLRLLSGERTFILDLKFTKNQLKGLFRRPCIYMGEEKKEASDKNSSFIYFLQNL